MVMWNYSSNGMYWEFFNDPLCKNGKIYYSWNRGHTWSSNKDDPIHVPTGCMAVKLSWGGSETALSARASNQTSINLYGRHFKKITDTTLTTDELLQARADYEVSGTTIIPKKGYFVINGKADMSTDYKFSANLGNFGFNEPLEIVSYTQNWDSKNGFSTHINYGVQPFDITRVITQLEEKVDLNV